MSAPKHTAGWRWERRGCRVYSSPVETVRPRLVASVNITDLDEAGIEARGRLIAAAPDLLDALADLASWFTAPVVDGRVWMIPAGERGADEAVDAARAALAKATGEAGS